MQRHILQNPIFRTLPLGPLSELMTHGEELSFSPGQALMRAGECNRFLYVLEEGAARIVSGDDILAEIGEGTIVGEVSTTGTRSPAGDVIAQDEVMATAFPMDVIDDLGLQYPVFAEQLRTLGSDCRY